jgi:hypothetical protein
MPDESIKQYQPVWRCIYCSDDENPSRLQKEHIVPLSLAGNLVLPRASCSKCAKKTSEFESIIARDIYGPMRIRYGLPTRHPDQRPNMLPLTIDFDDQTKTVEWPISDYPDIPISIPVFDPPGILTGAKREARFPTVRWMVLNPQPPAMHRNYSAKKPKGAKSFWLSANMQFFPFARMLAKIAHSFAVASQGVDAFEHLLPRLILGEDDTLPYFVGGVSGDSDKAAGESVAHQLSIGTRQIGEAKYLTTIIHLFPKLRFPLYEVITGRLID